VLAANEAQNEHYSEGEKVMKVVNYATDRSPANDLQQVIEPLANYICAADKARTALMSALAFLVREVEATNQAARTHFRGQFEA
jgi:hypothetical protein